MVEATGTQAASIGTEHTLHTNTGDKKFVLTVNLRNMQNADVLELRVYEKVLTGDSQSYLTYSVTYGPTIQGDGAAVGSSAQGEVVKVSIPVPSAYSITFTLKQTAGTGRSFDWRVDSL